MDEFWNSLGDGKGVVVGATVAFIGVLANIGALRWLDGFRAKKQEQARLASVRSKTYAKVVAACEARALMDRAAPEQVFAILSDWRGSRAKVRFVTDSVDVIATAEALVAAATRYGKSTADRDAFRAARTAFVAACRVELGRDDIVMNVDGLPDEETFVR